MRRIDKSHTALGHQSADGLATQKVFKLSQLSPGINAGNLTGIAMQIDVDQFAIRQKYLGNIRQIVLTLLVARVDSFERGKQFAAVEAVDTGVDLLDFLLLKRGILLLYYPSEKIIIIANNPAVAGWIFKSYAKNG